MSRSIPEPQRPRLTTSRTEARERVLTQLEKSKSMAPGASVIDSEDARRWYEYVEELLRQLFTTDALANEFTGRDTLVGYGDISVASYASKLQSIFDRLDLFPEQGAPSTPTPLANSLLSIENLVKKFHKVARQLRVRYDNRQSLDVTDEYDVQDLLHALLLLHFDDIRPEEWTPSYAGGSSRMDFLLKTQRVVVEVKKSRAKLGAKELGEQLATDILRYRSHPDCKTLICFIYDPEERITNPSGFERDLSQQMGELAVKVWVVQR